MATCSDQSLSTTLNSTMDYPYIIECDDSYTIDDISGVLDSPNVSNSDNPTKNVRRGGIQYGGKMNKRHQRLTAANDSSIFCEVTPLPLRRTFIDERVSDSIISIDEDISYDDTFLQEKSDRAGKGHPDDINTEMFRRFSPRRVAVKLMATSKRHHKRQSRVSKTRSRPHGLLRFMFLGKYGCLNKVLD